jgi:fibronectin type 3 domain-containing protein
VKWETVEGAAKYYIYRATGSGSFKYIKSAVSARSFEDTSAKAGISYSYKVKAISKSTSANSAYSEVVTQVCDLPKPAVSLKLNSSGVPYLTWKEISGAKNYRIYRCETKNGKYTYLGSTTKLKYADKTAEAGTKYFYKVKAMHTKSAASSAYSSVKYITAK